MIDELVTLASFSVSVATATAASMSRQQVSRFFIRLMKIFSTRRNHDLNFSVCLAPLRSRARLSFAPILTRPLSIGSLASRRSLGVDVGPARGGSDPARRFGRPRLTRSLVSHLPAPQRGGKELRPEHVVLLLGRHRRGCRAPGRRLRAQSQILRHFASNLLGCLSEVPHGAPIKILIHRNAIPLRRTQRSGNRAFLSYRRWRRICERETSSRASHVFHRPHFFRRLPHGRASPSSTFRGGSPEKSSARDLSLSAGSQCGALWSCRSGCCRFG